MLVQGQRAPVVGTACMDLTLVDLAAAPEAAVGDVATLIGCDGDAEITLEDVAAAGDTIAYEVLTGLGPRPQRRYLSTGDSPAGVQASDSRAQA